MLNHLVYASLSIVLGVVVAVLVNLVTTGFTWPLFAGLVSAVVALCLVEIVRYLRSSGNETGSGGGDRWAVAQGDGSVAIAGDSHAPVNASVARPDSRK